MITQTSRNLATGEVPLKHDSRDVTQPGGDEPKATPNPSPLWARKTLLHLIVESCCVCAKWVEGNSPPRDTLSTNDGFGDETFHLGHLRTGLALIEALASGQRGLSRPVLAGVRRALSGEPGRKQKIDRRSQIAYHADTISESSLARTTFRRCSDPRCVSPNRPPISAIVGYRRTTIMRSTATVAAVVGAYPDPRSEFQGPNTLGTVLPRRIRSRKTVLDEYDSGAVGDDQRPLEASQEVHAD